MANKDGSLTFNGTIARTPVGDVKVSYGADNKGMRIGLDADQFYFTNI